MIATGKPVLSTVRPGVTEYLSARDSLIPAELCRVHLEKVAVSLTFGRADQLRRLLKWLGDRSLAGSAGAPSEKEVAMAVLNRGDFDPQTDSLVRKEMGRLREKLHRYYAVEGARDDLRIRADNGYILTFERLTRRESDGGMPGWLVLPFRCAPDLTEESEYFLEEVLIGLSESAVIELISPTTALAYRSRVGDVRQFATECRADYVIEGRLRRQNDAIELTAWLVDGQSGRSRRCMRTSGSEVPELARRTIEWLFEQGIRPD